MKKTMSDDVSELFAAVSKATGIINDAGVKKTGSFHSNTAGNYKYAGSADIFEPVDMAMAQTGLSLMGVKTVTTNVAADNGKSRWIMVDIDYVLGHKSGQWMIVHGHGEALGKSYDDKLHAKAVTASQKEVNRLIFNIATKEDDNDRHDASKAGEGRMDRRKKKPAPKKPAPKKKDAPKKPAPKAPKKDAGGLPPMPQKGELWFEVAARETEISEKDAKEILVNVGKRHAGEKIAPEAVWAEYVGAIGNFLKVKSEEQNENKPKPEPQPQPEKETTKDA